MLLKGFFAFMIYKKKVVNNKVDKGRTEEDRKKFSKKLSRQTFFFEKIPKSIC